MAIRPSPPKGEWPSQSCAEPGCVKGRLRDSAPLGVLTSDLRPALDPAISSTTTEAQILDPKRAHHPRLTAVSTRSARASHRPHASEDQAAPPPPMDRSTAPEPTFYT